MFSQSKIFLYLKRKQIIFILVINLFILTWLSLIIDSSEIQNVDVFKNA